MRQWIWIGVAVLVVMAGCAGTDSKAGEVRTYRLHWDAYDGTGDSARAVWVLDGEALGRGSAGAAELKARLAKMERGSRVVVGPYYVNEPGNARRYPEELENVRIAAEAHGVKLLVPSAR